MKHKICVFTLLLLPVLSAVSVRALAEDCPLSGSWKSNEARTLASMHATGKLTASQRTLFENHFFGHLRMTYTCREITIRYAGDNETFAYELVRQDGRHITIRTYEDDSEEGKVHELRLEPDGRCYSAPVSTLGFREFFCRD